MLGPTATIHWTASLYNIHVAPGDGEWTWKTRKAAGERIPDPGCGTAACNMVSFEPSRKWEGKVPVGRLGALREWPNPWGSWYPRPGSWSGGTGHSQRSLFQQPP
jgi:hypothetical protein